LVSSQPLLFLPDKQEVELHADREQWLTPSWAAEALILRYFNDLTASDRVVEFGCGTGRWQRVLRHLFPETRSVGVESDPALAREAIDSGCEVIIGDACKVELPIEPTVSMGNWPFAAATFNTFLKRSHEILPEEGRCGVLTTVYSFQTTSRVMQYLDHWSVNVELLPRDMFPRLQDALVFALFRKNTRRVMVGLGLYDVTSAARALGKHYRTLVDEKPTTWWAAIESALSRLGGEATLDQIYAITTRVTGNQYWREKIRQQLQLHAKPISKGRWALA
jgi:cyclopropane fatty-acyl-phospholipid synthase-like methyltransferase